ncbi:MAG: hypothetical protein V8T86_12505 [Victivallis sp.]
MPVNGGGVLYLLHASAWTPQPRLPVGKIIAVYADGTKREFPVLSGQDCGNWWQPAPLSNAAVAWTGENAESFVGLYRDSNFPVLRLLCGSKPLRRPGTEFRRSG